MTDILRYSRAYGNFQRHFVKVIAKGRDELSERFETAEEAIEHIKSQGAVSVVCHCGLSRVHSTRQGSQ